MPKVKGPFDNALQPTAPAKAPAKAPATARPENRLNKRIQEPAMPVGQGEDALYVGIDLGTSRTSVSASNGQRHTVLSWVGYPKDIIARKRVGTKTVIGLEALDNRLALHMIKPLESGVINSSDPRCVHAVKELIGYALSLCGTKLKQPLYAVIGVPARASIENQKAILRSVQPFVSSAMVASEPFAVAYGLDLLTEALIIDIGAGTIDLCRMHGTMPEEADQVTIAAGGDAVDQRLEEEIQKRYKKVQLTQHMVREIKEKYGFVSDPHQHCVVTLTENGRPGEYDITEALQTACTGIVPPIVGAVHQLIGSFDPDFQARLRNNVVLAGGGSRLIGLPLLLEKGLEELGGGKVAAVDEPTYAGSNGALKMAMEMPARYWKALVT